MSGIGQIIALKTGGHRADEAATGEIRPFRSLRGFECYGDFSTADPDVKKVRPLECLLSFREGRLQ